MSAFETFILIPEILVGIIGAAILPLIIWSLISLGLFTYLLLKRRKRKKEGRIIPTDEEKITLKAIFLKIIPKKKQ